MKTVDPAQHHRGFSMTSEDLVGAWLLDEVFLAHSGRSVRPRCRGTLLCTPAGTSRPPSTWPPGECLGSGNPWATPAPTQWSEK